MDEFLKEFLKNNGVDVENIDFTEVNKKLQDEYVAKAQNTKLSNDLLAKETAYNAIKKQLEDLQNAQLTDEQKRDKQLTDLMNENKLLKVERNKNQAIAKFSQNGIAEELYKDFLEKVNFEDEKVVNSLVDSVVSMVGKTKNTFEKATTQKTQLPNGAVGNGSKKWTKDELFNLSTAELAKLQEQNPNIFNEAE